MGATKRVVVTGMGAVSAAGIGAQTLWEAARDGRSCIGEVTFPRPSRNRIKLAAQVRDFDPAAYIEASLLPFCDPVTSYLIVSADEAMKQAGLSTKERLGPRTAVIIGTGIGGMIARRRPLLCPYGPRQARSFYSPAPDRQRLPLHDQHALWDDGRLLRRRQRLFLRDASDRNRFQMIRAGMADRAIVGGTEDCITIGSMLAWEGLRVLTPNACRPFSKDRNGMVLGAGAGVFILESEELARSRGATPLVELSGYGTSSDAKDPVRPDAVGAAASMRYALEDAGITEEEIDYVNAHGTGTTVNDSTESEALGMIFGKRLPHVPVSSTKPIMDMGSARRAPLNSW